MKHEHRDSRPWRSSGWATSACRWRSSSASTCRRSDTTCPRPRLRHYRPGTTPPARCPPRSSRASQACRFTTDPQGAVERGRRRGGGADADRRGASAGPSAADLGQRDRWGQPEARRDRRATSRRCTRARPRRCACRCSSAARSGRWKHDFFVGYSPERINPGDKQHTLPRIIKVVAGDTPETLETGRRALLRRSCRPGSIGPPRSGWPRPPRSSRTPSAISTSR